MIINYNNFLLSDINESVIYYSPNFRNNLKKIRDNKIAKDLLDLEGSDIKSDITFIDNKIDTDGYVTFAKMNDVWERIKDKSPSLEYLTKDDIPLKSRRTVVDSMYNIDFSQIFSKSRNDLKIGKLVNKVLPKKYDNNEIEKFTNEYKSTFKKNKEKFKLVNGNDIAYWYDLDNYKSEKGQLGNSCMSEVDDSFFEIYTENPEVCKLLILLEDDKLIGRALVWKLYNVNNDDIPNGVFFMDRQYTINDHDVIKFKKYAENKGWAYKNHNNHYSFNSVTYKGESYILDMEVEVKNINYSKYPYLDTFRRFDPENNILHNDDEQIDGNYILGDTNGDYEEIETGIWSDTEGRHIDEEEAVWSEWADDYLSSENAVRIDHGYNEGWYPEDSEVIVWDEWDGEPIHVDDSVYSESYGYNIKMEDAVKVIEKIDSNGYVDQYDENWKHKDETDIILKDEYEDTIWYDNVLSMKDSNWEYYDAVEDHLLIKNYNDEFIIKNFAMNQYKIKGKKPNSINLNGVEYLSKLDAIILGYNIDEKNYQLTDKFTYHNEISELLEKITEQIENRLSILENDLEGRGQLRMKIDSGVEESIKKQINILKYRKEEIKDETYTY